jgi:hypothetical protein
MIGPTTTKKLDKSNMSRFDTSLESRRFNNIVYKKSNASRSGTPLESRCFNNIVLKTQSVEIWDPSGISTFQQYCFKNPIRRDLGPLWNLDVSTILIKKKQSVEIWDPSGISTFQQVLDSPVFNTVRHLEFACSFKYD